MITKMASSNILDAYIEQTYGSYDKIEEVEAQSTDVLNKVEDIKNDRVKEAHDILSRPQELMHYMEIPTQLKAGELDQKTIPHKQLANYDHSLEMDRLQTLRSEYDYVEPEHTENTDSTDIQMSTELYENIDPAEVPNLNGLFDNVFGI